MTPSSRLYVAVEGIDGTGKTFVARHISEKFNFIMVQEPSDSDIGMLVRKSKWDPATDFFLFMADRANMLRNLPSDVNIISDRSLYSSFYSFDTIEIGTGNYMIAIISTSGTNTGELTIVWSFSDAVTSDSPNQILNNVNQLCSNWCNDNKEVCLHTSLGLNSCINGLFTGYSGNENIIQYVINLLVIPVSSYPNNSPFYSLFQSSGTPYNLQGLQYVIVTNNYQPIAYKQLQFVSGSTLPVSGYKYAIAYYGIGGVPYALVDGSIPSNEVVLTVNFNMSGDIQTSNSSYP
ncbi:MAG: hypothetical protein QXT48_05045 [Thermoplasmatales archaeon]